MTVPAVNTTPIINSPPPPPPKASVSANPFAQSSSVKNFAPVITAQALLMPNTSSTYIQAKGLEGKALSYFAPAPKESHPVFQFSFKPGDIGPIADSDHYIGESSGESGSGNRGGNGGQRNS